ncbi:MAG: acyltransferase [Pseudomonadota bacterium]|nr:acyltransferase [Pseudomonadota bacterium]
MERSGVSRAVPSGPAPRCFPAVDLIRLGAAFLVVLYHLAFLSRTGDPSRAALAAIEPLAASGWVGVPIFFVISGFVIACSARGKTARQFITGRASRLYPAAWVCATVTMLVAFRPGIGLDYVRTLALWPIGPWVSGVYWTLAVEMAFYALVALVLAQRGSAALPRLAVAIGGVSTLYWIVRVVAEARTGSSDWLFGSLNYFAGHLLLLRSGCMFALGMLIWDALDTADYRRWRLIVAFGMCSFLSVYVRAATLATEAGSAAAPLLVPPLLWLAAVLMLAGAVVWNTTITALIGRHGALVRMLGLMTYPLYLIHSELGAAVLARTTAFGPWLSLLVAVVAVLLAAALVLPIEAAIRRSLRRTSIAYASPAIAPAAP